MMKRKIDKPIAVGSVIGGIAAAVAADIVVAADAMNTAAVDNSAADGGFGPLTGTAADIVDAVPETGFDVHCRQMTADIAAADVVGGAVDPFRTVTRTVTANTKRASAWSRRHSSERVRASISPNWHSAPASRNGKMSPISEKHKPR